jgi:hypothetical protein
VKKRRVRIPRQKRDELIAIYLAGGIRGVARAAADAGVTGKYVSSAASSLGLTRHKSKRGFSTLTFDDPRWERARAVGEVCA